MLEYIVIWFLHFHNKAYGKRRKKLPFFVKTGKPALLVSAIGCRDDQAPSEREVPQMRKAMLAEMPVRDGRAESEDWMLLLLVIRLKTCRMEIWIWMKGDHHEQNG